MTYTWIILCFAGLLEIIWAWCIKQSDGCRHLWWTIAGLSVAIISIIILSYAMRKLPASTSYAVWAGIGAAGTAILGMTVLKEPVSLLKITALVLIVLGIIGLRLEESS